MSCTVSKKNKIKKCLCVKILVGPLSLKFNLNRMPLTQLRPLPKRPRILTAPLPNLNTPIIIPIRPFPKFPINFATFRVFFQIARLIKISTQTAAPASPFTST